ncbi:hypothetical protein AYO37_00850 [Opitutia bacterium SCGC AG-212-L18]|nr:hypothetical protein AYO37_00850 [Opitutae bacterium SCGC AG-212-L18]
MFKQAKDLLSFKAFKPSKLDVKVQLRERFFKSGPIMGISISKHCLTCAEIQFASPAGAEISKIKVFPVTINCEEDKQEETELKAEEESVSIITAFAKEHGLSHALLLNSPEIQIQKVNRASRKIGVDRLYDTKYAMDIMFAGPVEEGRAYAYVGNSIADETLIFSYHQEKVDAAANLLAAAGLELVRVTCSIYAIIDYLLQDYQSGFLSQNQILLIYSSDCLFVALIWESSFQQIGFRANIEAPDMPSHISRIIERFECEPRQVSYVNCSNWDIQTYFSRHYPRLKLAPIFLDSFSGAFQAASYG